MRRPPALGPMAQAWWPAALLAGGLITGVAAARELAAQRSSLRELRMKIADAGLLTARMPQEEAALAQTQAQHEALAQRIGRGQSLVRILEQVSEQAKAHRLEMTATQSRPSDDGRDAPREASVPLGTELALREVPLTLRLSGRYRQLGEFLGGLPKAPYLAAVKSLRLSRPSTESPKVQADLVLSVYLAP